MQVKKFEAPTLQEALETIKRELGPEAIILQTKQNRKGFGLMSKGSVEVTAAVSGRALEKKKTFEKKLPEAYTQKLGGLSASKQADIYENYLEKKIGQERVQLSNQDATQQNNQKRMTAIRYADIQDDILEQESIQESTPEIPEIEIPRNIENSLQTYADLKNNETANLAEEVRNLKKLVEELRRERSRPEYLDSNSPYEATEALQEAFEFLLHGGISRRFAISILRTVARNLKIEDRADRDRVLDAVAEELLSGVESKPFFRETKQYPQGPQIVAFVGPSGSGKTSILAKLATHSIRERNERIGLIRIQLSKDEGTDPLSVFSKAVHVPYRLVNTENELVLALQDLSQCGWIFIDTPGISYKDKAALNRLTQFLKSDHRIRVELVLNSITRDFELGEQGKAFQSLKPESLIFTRLDEASTQGNIFTLSKNLKTPLSVFSSGKKVTEDWENATSERLTASILNLI